MTRKDFLDFEIEDFYKPGYENELKYMAYINAVSISALTHARTYYNDNNKILAPEDNREKYWLLNSKPLNKENISPKSKEFMDCYELLLKKFIKEYSRNYAEISSDDKKPNYYSANSVDIAIQKLFDDVSILAGLNVDRTTLARCGSFIDMRLPIVFSFENSESKEIIPNSKTDEMNKFEASLIDTTEKTVSMYIRTKQPTNPENKRNK